MTDNRFLSAADLADYGADEADLASQAHALMHMQSGVWPMLQNGLATLSSVVVRTIDFPQFAMKVQFNPGRIASSAAKVDSTSISERKCFLCLENLPPAQRGIETGDYVILCNPFPIFPEHFTIAHKEHIDQRIAGSFAEMLRLTKALGTRYSLFYNGPRCGASAPDHLHFQAGTFGFMKLNTTWEALVEDHGTWLREEGESRVAAVDDSLRRFIVIQSGNESFVRAQFERLYEAAMPFATEEDDEPMFNIITTFRGGRHVVLVFLRRRHRPDQFYLEGDNRIVFSPASVDFGGVCITPVERDFHRMNRDLLSDMFGQLSVTEDVLQAVSGKLR